MQMGQYPVPTVEGGYPLFPTCEDMTTEGTTAASVQPVASLDSVGVSVAATDSPAATRWGWIAALAAAVLFGG